MGRRTLAIDYGEKRIGLAISDETATLARPLAVIPNDAGVLDALTRICLERDLSTVVVGHPRTLKSARSQATEAAEHFAAQLAERLGQGVNVILWDERLTTAQAIAAMRDSGADQRRGRSRVDAVSAALLLQSYLDRRSPKGAGQ